jgi:hypothetical protein
MDTNFRKLTVAFGNAAKASAFAKHMQDYGYNREPIVWKGDRLLTLVYKESLEKEVMTVVQAHGGYKPSVPTPLWPPGRG